MLSIYTKVGLIKFLAEELTIAKSIDININGAGIIGVLIILPWYTWILLGYWQYRVRQKTKRLLQAYGTLGVIYNIRVITHSPFKKLEKYYF